MGMIHLASFFASLLLSILLTRYVRDVALRRGWIAALSSHHIHRRRIPRLGGIAIFATFTTITVLLMISSIVLDIDLGVQRRIVFYILLPGALIFALGLCDDVYSLKPGVKFAVQGLAALMLYWAGIGKFYSPSLLGLDNHAWLALPLTIFWVLWITNAFNLLDGLDGLAAGSSLFSTFTVLAVSLINGHTEIQLLALVLAGTILGFLRFNFNPATIFLGDSGSLFLGFLLSALALAGSQKTPTVVAVALPIVCFGLPLIETSLSVIRRFLNGHPLFSADREHIHHKLLERGLTQRQAVIILYGVSALCGLLSLFLLQPGSGAVVIVLFTLGAGIWIGVRQLHYYEFDELRRAAQRTIDQRRVIANDLAIRRAGDRLPQARTFLQLCCILQEAFEANDFDGFQLSFSRISPELHFADELWLLAQDRKDEHQYTWHKPIEEHDDNRSLVAKWTLTIELETVSKHRFGSFSLYRVQCDKALMVDLNLLTLEFKRSLAEAVEGILQRSQQQTEDVRLTADRQVIAGALQGGNQPPASFGFETA